MRTQTASTNINHNLIWLADGASYHMYTQGREMGSQDLQRLPCSPSAPTNQRTYDAYLPSAGSSRLCFEEGTRGRACYLRIPGFRGVAAVSSMPPALREPPRPGGAVGINTWRTTNRIAKTKKTNDLYFRVNNHNALFCACLSLLIDRWLYNPNKICNSFFFQKHFVKKK